MSRFYITTAIEYANGEPHLGHAYEKIAADAIARFRRLRGDDVHFLVGTDEHGLKVARAAAAAGVAPRQQADRITAAFRAAWDALGISYDGFVRTTDPRHAAGVDAIIRRILERDPEAFYERAYEGWYCVGCEAFRTDHDLVAGAGGRRCPLHPTLELERVAETNWFFRLSRYAGVVETLLRDRPDFVAPESRRNELLAFVRRGLEDVSITRATLDWGIRFPLASSTGEHQVIYVWFDALPSYLTAVGFPDDGYERRWPARLHVIGKDITRFHCVLWPAILHAAGLPLPEGVWAHGFVTVNGERLSKSAGVWIDLHDAIARHGADALRYFLLREIPFDGDGDFGWARFDARYTGELANTLGNLASRVSALAARHLPAGELPRDGIAGPSAEDRALEARAAAALDRYVESFDGNRPHRALDAVWDALAAGNEYITRVAPWTLAGDAARRPEFARALTTLVALLARQAVLLAPVLPAKADELWRALGGPGSVHERRLGDVRALDPGGWRVTAAPPLFPRPPLSR